MTNRIHTFFQIRNQLTRMYTAFDRDCRERFVPQISVLTPDGAVPDDYLGESKLVQTRT